jgi:hypothetical protein
MEVHNTQESLAAKQVGIKVGSKARALTQMGSYLMKYGVILADKGSDRLIRFDNGDEVKVPKQKIILANSVRSTNRGAILFRLSLFKYGVASGYVRRSSSVSARYGVVTPFVLRQ